MNDASHESQDDAPPETSGPPSPGDPDGGPEPRDEARTPSATDAEPGARPGPEPGQDGAREPEHAPEPTSDDTPEPGTDPEQPPTATGHAGEEDDAPKAAAENEEGETPEHPAPPPTSPEPPSAGPASAESPSAEPDSGGPSSPQPTSAEAVSAGAVSAGFTSAGGEAAEAVPGEDETATAEHVRPEPVGEPEGPRPGSDEPRGEGKATGTEESGGTHPAELRSPPQPRPPAPYQDHTVMDLPRLAHPLRRRPSQDAPPTAPYRPAPPEPRTPHPAPGPVPQPRTPAADRRPEAQAPGSLLHPAADRRPEAEAPVPSRYPAADRRPQVEAPTPPLHPAADHRPEVEAPASPRYPAASARPVAPPTVEQALPARRPNAPGDFASTTQRDGLPMVTPPAAATTSSSYAAAPPRTPPPPAPAIASGPTRPPLTEAPAQARAEQLPPAEPPVRRKRRRGGLIAAVIALVLLAGLVAGQLVRPVPAPKLRLTLSATRYTFNGPGLDLPWPDQGQATLYAEGLGSMGSSGGQAPTPTASVAKVMTAYVVLHDHALRTGEEGPTFQISAEEAARLPERKQRGESLVEVVAGQEFTEHKALEALLIVSANNLAHELARWDAGDEQAFVAKMNAAARSLGMTATTYTDPSGYDSHTVSTAADQVKLLTAAMKLPAFAEIVAMHTYEPNDGRPPRSGGDILVGRHGVIGGKTGYTDAAGGNFVFAAQKRIGKTTTTIIGAVMGQQSPSAMGAIEVAQRLVVGAENALTSVTLAKAGARVALVDDGLGGRVPLRAAAPVTVVGWSGLTVPVRVTGVPPRQAAGDTRVGAVRAGSAVTSLTLDRDLNGPSILKRLLRLA